jgi:hypothetical protein
MAHSRRAQVTLEHLGTHLWAMIIMTMMLGAMMYFDLFDTSRYAAQSCAFDSNFYCHDYSIEKNPADNKFSMRLLAQNLMELPVEINIINIYDAYQTEIMCDKTEIFCKFDEAASYAEAMPSNETISITDPAKKWDSTMLCKIELTGCGKLLITDEKQEINMRLNFTGEGKTASHLSYARVYATVG